MCFQGEVGNVNMIDLCIVVVACQLATLVSSVLVVTRVSFMCRHVKLYEMSVVYLHDFKVLILFLLQETKIYPFL